MLAPRRPQLPALRRDRAAERALMTRQILARERALEAHLARVIAAAGRRAAAAARHGEAPRQALATLADDLGRVIAPALADTAQAFGARVIQAPKSQHAFPLETKAFEDLDQAIRVYSWHGTARRVVAVSDSLRETIRRIVEEAIADNIGQEELAQRIVEATSGEIGMARARRIARTEIHAAAMFGQQVAAESSPLAFEKVWLATEDVRTRKSHADANGQRVALDEPFVLTTESGATVRLRYPGDANGPPGEIINCRCVCLYEPLPMLKEPGQPEVQQVPDRPIDIELPELDEAPDEAPAPAPTAEPLPERDLAAVPYERGPTTVYAAATTLVLRPDGTPSTGSTVQLIGPNRLYDSPDAPEVDREIAAAPSFLGFNRPVLWQIDIPGGATFPQGLVEEAGAGVIVNSGVAGFGLVELRIRAVRKLRWGEAAPKDMVDPTHNLSLEAQIEVDRLVEQLHADELHQPIRNDAESIATRLADRLEMLAARERDPAGADEVIATLRGGTWESADLLHYVRELLDRVESDAARTLIFNTLRDLDVTPPERDASPTALAQVLARYLQGERVLAPGDANAGAPVSVIRALMDTPWNRRSLLVYLERLLAGEIQHEREPGEPDEHARVILVEATADFRPAIPKEGS